MSYSPAIRQLHVLRAVYRGDDSDDGLVMQMVDSLSVFAVHSCKISQEGLESAWFAENSQIMQQESSYRTVLPLEDMEQYSPSTPAQYGSSVWKGSSVCNNREQ